MSINETQGHDEGKPNPSGDFDLDSMTDAGQSNLMTDAEKEAESVAVNLSHRENDAKLSYIEAYNEPCLVTRVRLILKADPMAFNFPHYTQSRNVDFSTKPVADSELNYYEFFNRLFDDRSGSCTYPHRDDFSGASVDHLGRPLEKGQSESELIRAANACGLDNPSSERIRRFIGPWIASEPTNRNSLIDRIDAAMPVWDGKERIETILIKLFKSKDTESNRKIGRYFWLSLYARTYCPGSLAPIAIAIFGAQGAGKTRFSNELCRAIMGSASAKPATLDFSQPNYNKFLCAITGKSIIANAGEMVGFKTADMNRIKDFVSSVADDFDYKYRNTDEKARQWIIILDGNKYEGLQRDETGNRRFYPFFMGQLPDKNGSPAWEKDFEVDYTGFRDVIWQLMAEARAWIEAHGWDGYDDYVNECTHVVRAFSEAERSAGRGTVVNEDFESAIGPIMSGIPYDFLPRGAKRPGISVDKQVIKDALNDRRARAYGRSFEDRLRMYGFELKGSQWIRYFDSDPEGVSPSEYAESQHALLAEVRRDILRQHMGEAAEAYEDDDLDHVISGYIQGMARYNRAAGATKGSNKPPMKEGF